MRAAHGRLKGLTATREFTSPYRLKRTPYSSHSVLMRLFPEEGKGATVLDVGCGTGYLAVILADRGFRVTGIERAGGYGPNFPERVELIEADLEQGLPDLPSRFDYVLAADVLEHFRRPDLLLEQLRSVMAPGGRLIASVPNSGNLYFRLNILCGRFPQHDTGLFDRTHVRFYMLDGWRDLLVKAGFRIDWLGVTGIPFSSAFPRYADSLMVRAAERISYDLARLWKTMFAYQFIASARPQF